MFWIFLIYGLTGASCFHTTFYTFHFVAQSRSWWEAQRFCRQHYDDLATVRDGHDLLRLRRHAPSTEYAWIGLFDATAAWTDVVGSEANSWRWSATGNTSTSRYQNWVPGEPNFAYAAEACLFFQSGRWSDGNCAVPLYFVCFTGFPRPGFKNFTLVVVPKSWAESRAHCRQHHTDLAVIQDQEDNSAVGAVATGYRVWVGLHREPWAWSDGSTGSFTNWMQQQPGNNGGNQHCVLENRHHQWNDGVCSHAYPFFCQRRAEKGKVLIVNLRVQSGSDLSQPNIWTQLLQKIKESLLQTGLSDLRLQWNGAPKAL